MKKFLISLIIVTFFTPVIAFADGRADYRATCASCHSPYPTGHVEDQKAKILKTTSMKLALSASKMNRDEMIAITEKGKGTMPAYKDKLTKDQIAGVVDYIISAVKKK
ncbi:MAG: c-type cytochrome [Syntrophales bacterium]|jgi:mono/diheme cytochrome c family protein|nr:c-type cytochrome [Syntrophales bacterium]